MNKLISIIVFFCSVFLHGKNNNALLNKKITIDTSAINARKFSTNFKKNYTDKSFIYEFNAPEKNAWDRFKEWLYDLLKDFFNLADKTKSLETIEIVIRVLAGLLILFVIYLIVKAILNKEGNWIFGRNSKTKLTGYEDAEKNIHLADFKKLIAEAIAKEDKRLATRFYYLWLLKKMSDSKIIEWHPEKTSTEYAYEITNNTQKENFQYLSYLYNYIWYGEFEVTEEIFTKTKQAFEKSITKLF